MPRVVQSHRFGLLLVRHELRRARHPSGAPCSFEIRPFVRERSRASYRALCSSAGARPIACSVSVPNKKRVRQLEKTSAVSSEGDLAASSFRLLDLLPLLDDHLAEAKVRSCPDPVRYLRGNLQGHERDRYLHGVGGQP